MKRNRETEEAQIFLERFEKLESIVYNKLDERQMWGDLALSITANMGGERVQSSGSKSRMSDAVDVCIDAEAEILDTVKLLRGEMKKITDLIESLDSPMEYKVLHDKYIKGMSHAEIAEKYGHDVSWSTTTCGRALKNVWAMLHKE